MTLLYDWKNDINCQEVVWDDFNIAHIGEHDVSVDEAEDVCNGKVGAFLSHSGRFIVIDDTKGRGFYQSCWHKNQRVFIR